MQNSPANLLEKRVLTAEEVADIQQLAARCDRHDNLRMRIPFAQLRQEAGEGEMVHDFLYYEDDKLVGYLSLDRYHVHEKELTGMVHPAYRRRGIFRSLFNAACQICMKHGMRKLLLVCESTAASGQAFIQSTRAVYAFSEHRMMLRDFQEKGLFDDRLVFQRAFLSDIDKLVSIMASEYSGDEARARRHLLNVWQDPDQRCYFTTFGSKSLGCHEPVGMVRVEETPEELGIYGFVVRPDYRRQGYGRQMLVEVINTVRETSQKELMLEVDTDNTPALRLYLSTGFVIERTYNYYGLSL